MSDYEGAVDSPDRDRNPSPPPELQANAELLEADSISNTAFSKHWLFSTLMKLLEEVDKENKETDEEFGVDVDEELQNELCKVWDMSMNMNVAKFLHEFQGLDIMMEVINRTKAPRVMEICVGILGNMACDREICQVMAQNPKFINMAVLLLENRDPPTLVETTRLLSTNLSKAESNKAWLSALRDTDSVLQNLMFIFNSSTNCDLLKNAAECLDVVLDQDEELCESWATTDLIKSQLEAIKQIGYEHSEALEIYFHIFQLFSTSEAGVESLVKCSKSLTHPLMKYLDVLCEDEIVGLEGRHSCLASALSVLNILFLSDEDTQRHLATSEKLTRIILKVLEPLYPWLSSLKQQTSQESSTPSNSSNSSHSDSSSVNNNKNSNNSSNDCLKSTPSTSKTDQPVQKSKGSDEAICSQLSILHNIVKGFLYDLITTLCDQKESDIVKALVFLNSSCSRTRLKYLILTLQETNKEPVDALAWLTDMANEHNQERLTRIINDTLSGKHLEREDSDPSLSAS